MIKINKDISAIPKSLRLPTDVIFSGNHPSQPRTTHSRRMEVINACRYINEDKYNNRYKQSDTQEALTNIYNKKCAYCEQKVEQSHVEHYRPKAKYYWLAYSWDNLILACPYCNEYKDVNFELQGTEFVFQNTLLNISEIHSSSAAINSVELPKMINPEINNPLGYIEFEKNGLIKSNDVCFAYTIEKCKIDRTYLNDSRRKIINDFKDKIRAEISLNHTIHDKEIAISVLIRSFIKDSQNVENEFLAFRRFAISSGWLNEITKDMN